MRFVSLIVSAETPTASTNLALELQLPKSFDSQYQEESIHGRPKRGLMGWVKRMFGGSEKKNKKIDGLKKKKKRGWFAKVSTAG